MEIVTPNIFGDEVIAFVTMKNSGFKGGKIEGLNLGINTSEDEGTVIANRKVLNDELGGLDVVCANQVHKDEIYIVTNDDRGRGWLEPKSAIADVDGFVTNKKGLMLTVFLADCVGVLMYDPKHKAIAALHSGWRGTRACIVNKGVRILGETYGSKPQDIKVYITPSIRSCCYTVGEDVKKEFEAYPFALDKRDGGYSLDLASIIIVDLLKKGVLERNIELSHLCTCCQKELYSYRREGDRAGRMAAMIGLV